MVESQHFKNNTLLLYKMITNNCNEYTNLVSHFLKLYGVSFLKRVLPIHYLSIWTGESISTTICSSLSLSVCLKWFWGVIVYFRGLGVCSQNAGIAVYNKWESQNNGKVSQNAGIAAYKKWESQNIGTVLQNAGFAAHKKMGVSEQWYSFIKCRDRSS
jgi:hypothetical protein